MANLSKKQRDALPVSAFGDPTNRLFPITDQDDVDSAARLIGKAKNPAAVKRRIIAIAHRLKLSIPDAWKEAQMSAGADYVVKRGKVFQAGDYPDKEFSLTPEEMVAAIADFSPVPVDLEHQPTVLAGHLGTLAAVEQGSDPYDLIGDVELAPWLDSLIGDEPINVSAAWDRQTKRITGLSLVLKGRVDDAAVFAAFSASQGAPGVSEPPNGGGKDHTMSWTEKLKSWVSGGMEGEAPLPETVVSAPPAVFSAGNVAAIATPDPEITALKARVAATEAENIRLRQEGIAERASAFYAAEFAAHRVVPAEEEAVIAAFTQAATDDATHGVVTFSAGVTKSRVDLLKAQYAVRPAHVLTQEMISAAGVTEADARALFNQQVTARAGAEKPLTPERKSELLAMTPLGQATLSGRQN